MAATGLHGLFEIQSGGSSNSPVASPPIAHQKKHDTQGRHTPANIELNDLVIKDPQPSKSGTQTPKTPIETEQVHPPSNGAVNDAVDIMHSWNDPPINKWRILSCCLQYLANGIQDAGS